MMELFDRKFVHFMWDNELIGKKCFFADGIDDLRGIVEKGGEYDMRIVLSSSGNESAPFQAAHGVYAWKFAYYDPNHSIKKAFNEGKTIQYQSIDELNWRDVENEESFEQYLEEGRVFRIKPENEKKWIVYLNREIQFDGKDCYLTACREDRWESVQKDYGAKTKLFIGSESEVLEWFKAREKFASLIKAWEDGKTIQCNRPSSHIGWIDTPNPNWDVDLGYRIKPDCPCTDSIDSRACVGCEHSEDGKPHPFENYHCYGCDKSSKTKYRPYINSAEMIVDFIDRFKVKCPSYCEPLIWLKGKATDKRSLVIGISPKENKICVDGGRCDLLSLFTLYTYLDGSPVGMEIKK